MIKIERRREMIEFIQKNYEKLTLTEIADHLVICKQTLMTLYKAAKVKNPRSFTRTSPDQKKDRADFIRSKNGQWTIRELSKAMKCDKNFTIKLCRELDLPYRSDERVGAYKVKDTGEFFDPDAVKGEDTYLI